MSENNEIRLAMLGMVDGNGHPYSWSAIFNGYDEKEMASCPFPGIPEYLGKEPKESLIIKGAKVTHIWTDDPEDAKKVSKASLIKNVVDRPEDVIGQVDAVIIATDKGFEHVKRCLPFIGKNIPIFIDKPLADNEEDLKIFMSWVRNGEKIMSSSCMRYCKEFAPYRMSVNNLGKLRYASISTPKSWERYGIHALEGIYPILGPGFVSVRNVGEAKRDIVHLRHKSGTDVIIPAVDDMYGSFGVMQLCGTKDNATAVMKDSFYSFKKQLEAFVEYIRTGYRPFPFEETVELMKMVIAGILSRKEKSEIYLEDIAKGIKL
jgi:predicted dehydrogenase